MQIRKALRGFYNRGLFTLQVRKVVIIAVIINVLQIAVMIFASIALYSRGALHEMDEYLPVMALFVLVVVGAVISIQDARSTARLLEETEHLSHALENVEKLNSAIRAQRHDFMNHLQVVHSLIELNESAEANAYIERIYGDIRRSTRALRTDSPAINALLAAKIGDCEERDIEVEVDITSTWKNLPMPAWEMCRVLGNLLDNAMDAVAEHAMPRIHIEIFEDLHAFGATVSNNGPMIPMSLKAHIFSEGVTTKKGEGHGMGLYNVHRILSDHDGEITLESDAASTRFAISVPRTV